MANTTNADVIYAFAVKRNGSSRTTNVSTSNNRLYSYNSLLAEWNDDTIVIRESIARYSNTSSKHASILRSMIGDTKVAIYYNNDASTIENSYILKIMSLITMYSRARKMKLNYKEQIERLNTKLIEYMEPRKYDRGYKRKTLNTLSKVMNIFHGLELWAIKRNKTLTERISSELTS